MSSLILKAVIGLVLAALPLALAGQTKRKPAKPKPVAAATPAPTPEPTPTADPPKNQGKANARPVKAVPAEDKNYAPNYFYTFDRPGFTYGSIKIEHDENGKGRISMKRDGYDEMFTDPIQVSPATMEDLKSHFAQLHFLDSTDDYQYPGRDYSHLGNVTITLKSAGKERTAKFNWTENKDAKALMDAYRGISNEFTWRLEIISARENQPLLAPGLIEAFDGYIQRNEINDPLHLIPFLTELASDGRIPLLGRNRLTRIIERIQKAAKH